jgi:hypothetical protein
LRIEDGDCHFDRQAHDFKRLCRFQNEDLWVPK